MKIVGCTFLITVFACLCVACNSDDVVDGGGGSHSSNSGMIITMKVNGAPQYMKPVSVSFTYRVDPNELREIPDTVIASSSVKGLPTFDVVSGDTAWVDTLAAVDTRTHTFVMRPRFHGTRIQCAGVFAFIDSALTIASGHCLEITVP